MEQPFSDEHTIEVVAQSSDMDMNGHVSNLVYLRWVQDAAVAHSEAVGWDHARYVAAGAAFFVRRHEIDYFAAAMEGDRVQITTYVSTWSAATSQRHTRIVRGGKELARCVTTWAFVGLNGRPRRIPADVVEAFRRKGAT
jgi:acyl-CoA thioester hydrolase